MRYRKSHTRKWHRADCPHGPAESDAALTSDQLPLEAEHCQHCIASFQFATS